jgi:O-methyltransferase
MIAGTMAAPADSPSVAAARLLQIIEAKFGDGLTAAPEPQASGPADDLERLRVAYLDLLKLSLCDVASTRTTSVARTMTGEVMSRELEGEGLRMRTAGMDWPLHGLTMVGLARLGDLQRCVESVVRDGVPGDLVETGSWRGGASMLMRATLDSLGAHDRTLWVCDSFQGFPEREATDGYDLSADLAACDFLAIPLEEVRASFARLGLADGVEFVPGFFDETLPGLTGRQWSVIRLDGDTYDATRLALDVLYPGLAPGGYLVVDDYRQLEECSRAVDEFRDEYGITDPIEHIDWNGVRWRRGDDRSITTPAHAAAAATGAPPDRPVERPGRLRVPAIEEVELQEELARTRERLAAAEVELARLRATPWRRAARRARSALR